MMLGILFGLFFLLLFIGMPVAYGMVISAVVTLFFDPSLTGIIIPQKLFTGMDSFSLMAVHFFMLAGTLMEKSGITDILVNWAKSLVGHFKGGLGHATIVTGVVMAGVSGSANADTSALASILVPIMRKDGYDDGYSCALVSSCGALGPVIPPSIMMVLYSGVTSIAIGKLFMAGIIPGLVIAIGYMIVNGVYARKAGLPKSKFVGWKALGQDTLKALPALIMPVIIIGGILSGATTATEAGVVACVYSIIYGFIRKTMNSPRHDQLHDRRCFCRYLRHPCHELQPLQGRARRVSGLPRQPLPDPDIHQHHPLHSRYVHRFQRCDAHARAYLHPAHRRLRL